MGKEADASGTQLMPNTGGVYSDLRANPAKTIRKVGEALPQNEGQSGEQMQSEPQAKPFKLRVDTTGKEAPTVATQKEAQYYALPRFGRYPLDSYAHVKTAAQYFDDNYKQMEPEIRREYCQNLVKRASMLGIKVGAMARKYGSDTYAKDAEVEAALAGRLGVIKEAMHLAGLQHLQQTRPLMNPEDFAVALGEFDKVAGISELYDSHVLDPYYSTYGVKTAEDDDNVALLIGNDYISATDLKRFARTCANKLHDAFGEDFVKEFRKDPVAITSSLPADQKKMVIRLAASTLTDPTTT